MSNQDRRSRRIDERENTGDAPRSRYNFNTGTTAPPPQGNMSDGTSFQDAQRITAPLRLFSRLLPAPRRHDGVVSDDPLPEPSSLADTERESFYQQDRASTDTLTLANAYSLPPPPPPPSRPPPPPPPPTRSGPPMPTRAPPPPPPTHPFEDLVPPAPYRGSTSATLQQRK
ncbi:MAG: hypothetical protein Q9162_006633, partial [Coniocarpon cinnabarinum]